MFKISIQGPILLFLYLEMHLSIHREREKAVKLRLVNSKWSRHKMYLSAPVQDTFSYQIICHYGEALIGTLLKYLFLEIRENFQGNMCSGISFERCTYCFSKKVLRQKCFLENFRKIFRAIILQSTSWLVPMIKLLNLQCTWQHIQLRQSLLKKSLTIMEIPKKKSVMGTLLKGIHTALVRKDSTTNALLGIFMKFSEHLLMDANY